MTKSIFFQRLSATIQFILGFVIGISLIAGVSGAAVYAYYQKMSVLPKKPDFSEITASPEPASDPTEDLDLESSESNNTLEETEVEPEPEVDPELPPNAYRAVVTWPEGLSLRSEPTLDAGRIGGIGADATIIILEDSTDGKWQRVRLPWNGQEGWVKGGNTERTSY